MKDILIIIFVIIPALFLMIGLFLFFGEAIYQLWKE